MNYYQSNMSSVQFKFINHSLKPKVTNITAKLIITEGYDINC